MSASDHYAFVLQSEGMRQSDQAAALTQFQYRQGAEPAATLSAAVKAANIAHYRRVLASAIANGVSTSCYYDALRTLGAI